MAINVPVCFVYFPYAKVSLTLVYPRDCKVPLVPSGPLGKHRNKEWFKMFCLAFLAIGALKSILKVDFKSTCSKITSQ